MKRARYTGVKRFAVHDGPGIRTTLFLKGCPLNCIWCHNPESISGRPELAFHGNACIHCGNCVRSCPCHTFTAGIHQIDRTRCIACGKCTNACPCGALELFGQEISTECAAELLSADRHFYGDAGGITRSGGEPLLQIEFCVELLKLLKRKKLHCAIDTCGCISWNAFERVLPFTDLFLYDFKEADPARHRRFTGNDNELILKNLNRLDASGKPIEIRMIQVPQHNMSEREIAAAADFLSSLHNITAVRLLAYHSQAHSKYRAVGRSDTLPAVPSPTFAELEANAAILRSRGLNVINTLENKI